MVTKRPVPGLIALALAALIAPSALSAQNGRHDVGTYVMGGAAVRVTAAAPRVELLVLQEPSALMIYLDGLSVLAWADSADKLLRLSRKELSPGYEEVETSILTNPDPSYANGVLLSRVFKGKRTQCYLSVWVGRNSYTAIPISDRDARSLVAALRRASLEVGGASR